MRSRPDNSISCKTLMLQGFALCLLLTSSGSVLSNSNVKFPFINMKSEPLPVSIEATPLAEKPFKTVSKRKKTSKKSTENIPKANGLLLSEAEIPIISSFKFSVNPQTRTIFLSATTNKNWNHQFTIPELSYDDESNQIILQDGIERHAVAYNVAPRRNKIENYEFQTYKYACFDWNLYPEQNLFRPTVRLYLNRSVDCNSRLREENFSDPEKLKSFN